jgi:hypothetical protein
MTNFKRLNIDTLTFNFLPLKDKILLNKIKRGISITHMEEALMPCKHGMEVTGHHDPISYMK